MVFESENFLLDGLILVDQKIKIKGMDECLVRRYIYSS